MGATELYSLRLVSPVVLVLVLVLVLALLVLILVLDVEGYGTVFHSLCEFSRTSTSTRTSSSSIRRGLPKNIHIAQ